MLPEDLYRIAVAEDAQISPDDERVAFAIRRMDRDADAYRSAIWIVPASGSGAAVQLTTGSRQDMTPRWSPDGRWLAFLSDRDGHKAQIWLLPVDGGEPHPLTQQTEAIERYAWSPKGDAIAFACRVPTSSPPRLVDAPAGGDSSGADGHPPARVFSSLRYKSNGDGFVHDRRRHIFVVAVADANCRQLTFGDFEDADPTWSPDGSIIAFSSARHANHELDTASDIFLVAAGGGTPRPVTDTRGPAASPTFSPDGSTIAFLGHDDPHAGGARNTGIWLVPAAGGAPRAIETSVDRSVVAETPPIWTKDGELVFGLLDRGAVGIWTIPANGGTASPIASGGECAAASWSMSSHGSRLAYTDSAPYRPADIWCIELESQPLRPVGGGNRRLTDCNIDWISDVEFVRPEPFEFAGTDGWQIQAWLTRPARFQEARSYPLLLNVHGGPHMYYGWGFFDEVHVQAGAGYATLCINPRGSQGYGEAFARACSGDWGGKDFEDLMAGVDEALRRFSFLDPARTGVLGGSYGGFMTSWIVGHDRRFKAAVSERAVNSLASLFGTSDIGYWFEQFEIGGDPQARSVLYAERSPLTYAGEIETPLLILHSENDLRCPIEQAEQLFIALKVAGRADVAFVRFPEENHELSRSGTPSHRIQRFDLILDWFDHYLSAEQSSARREPALAENLGW